MSTYVNDKFSAGSPYLAKHLRYNDYVEKGKTVEGHWVGMACEGFGVKQGAMVKEQDFNALRDNEHAVSHAQLTARHNTTRKESYVDKEGKLQVREVNNRKPFADMTTGAPKTSSIGAVVFKSELIHECHRIATAKMLREAERLVGRQAHNGTDHVLRTGNFCAAAYEHTSNRCLEPHLHQHTIIFNATQDARTGKNYAIEFAELANQSRYLTAVYWDTLSAELQAIGAELEIDEHGAPQIVALKEHEEIFSRRTKEIEDLIDRIEQYAGTKLSDRECKSLTLASRGFKIDEFERLWELNKAELDGLRTLDPEKAESARRAILDRFTAIVRKCSQDQLLQISAAEVEAAQQALLTEEQKARGIAFVKSLHHGNVKDQSRAIEADITFAIEHVFANQSVVAQYDLWKEILLHAQGKNVDINHMKAAVRADPRLVFGRGGEVGPIEHYRRELESILMVEQGKGRGVTIPAKELSASLNQSQRQTVKELLACSDQFALLYGIHGVGKTFSLAEVVRCYLEDGHKVFVLAPENGARDVLRKEGLEKIQSGPTATVFQCAQNLSEFLVNAKLQKGFGPGDLVILDEAGMSNLEDLHNFMGLARQKGFGVIFSGDDGQLTSVTAGDAFRILKEQSGIYVSMLTQIIRQSPEALDGHYLKAAQLLGGKKKKVREAFWELYQAGCIKEIKGQDRIQYYADRVMESLNGIKPSVMCNVTHRENDVISEIVRAKRKELGELTDERTLTVHRTLGWSLAKKKEIDKISPGMVLQVTRGADKGRAWKVLEVASGKALTEDPLGERRVFEKRHARMFDVCKPFDIPVAIGDHLRTHSGGKGRDKGKEIINGELFIVASWDMEGNPVDKEGKTLTIRNVSYGYTGTVRKVQGATQPKNIFGMDRQSIRAVSAELATVASTRGREDIEILVESVADLSQIEAKSSQRKAVCEMAIEPTAQPAEIRELLAQIERVRTRGLPIAKRLTAILQVGKTGDRQQEQHERAIVDLQLGARKRAAEKFYREQINEQSKEGRGMSR